MVALVAPTGRLKVTTYALLLAPIVTMSPMAATSPG